MIKVSIPDHFVPEVSYVFHCILNEILGIDYRIEISESIQNFVITTGDQTLEINNCFFNKRIDDLYSLENIPKSVDNASISYYGKKYEISSLFGKSKIKEEENKVIIESDIIGSIFFMLTRWEEMVIKKRDNHDRFPYEESLASKEGFLNRAIVNEYVEFLFDIINSTKQFTRKPRTFSTIASHDVDIPYLWWSKKQTIRSLLGKLRHGKIIELRRHLSLALKGKDPYDTFDFMMDLSDSIGSKSHFFFMTGGNTIYDNRYSIDHPRITRLISHIKKRGHHIGLHPSYNSFDNKNLLLQEKELLEDNSNLSIKTGRHHYLRFSIPETWQLWNSIGMKWDNTMTYAGASGFRCGICYPYPVYDIMNRKKLDLFEKPLIAMEASLINYENLSLEEAKKRVLQLRFEVKKYNGEFTFLWHNSSFNTEKTMKLQDLIYTMYGK